MSAKSKLPPGMTPAGSSGEASENGYGHCTTPPPGLSRIRLKTLCDLAGELSGFYLERCHELIDSPDSDFDQPFSMLIVCLDLQQIYLGRLNGGENV